MNVTEGRVWVSASDVANFLACRQLTQLDLQAARRTLWAPYAVDLGLEDLVRRGRGARAGGARAVQGGRARGGGPRRGRGP